MKNTLLIALFLLTLISCTKKGSTSTTTTTTSKSDTVYKNDSYFQVTVNGKSYTAKNVTIKALYCNVGVTDYLVGNSNEVTNVSVESPSGIYGLGSVDLILHGSNTGTYTFYQTSGSSGSSSVISMPGVNSYTDDPNHNPSPAGTANITHSGTDYFEGTFSCTLTSNNIGYPVTGSFKIYH